MTYVFSYFPISSAVFSDGVFVYMSFISYWIKCCCLVPWLGNNYSLKFSWFVRTLCTNLHMKTSLLFNERLRFFFYIFHWKNPFFWKRRKHVKKKNCTLFISYILRYQRRHLSRRQLMCILHKCSWTM